ncbi:hypothetical protein HMPREF1222_00117 [Treponema vincentii F0403]|mgnify:CR=1 FL=1|uniref:Uncharacterized protein n=1 Tax=Treponema vincentii F0403 TaxID=1125702 RepID=S3LTN2_9SPIR|nr:hypothetical protein [Treponema vincentii]EPF47857.1 hypothetical protein HMPREF1222_00117 [Treponema vincentii F0403]
MQTSFHGKDKGFVLLSAVALIFFVAALFFSLAPQFLYVKKKAQHSTDQIVEVIETENTRIRNKYDLY